MSALSAIKTILEADATLLAAATGGVYDLDEAGPLGLSRTLTPNAFDSNGIIKPTVLVKLRSSVPDGALADDANQYVTVREIIECWFYQNSGFAAIETMRNRVYTLLQAVQLTGTFMCYWNGDLRAMRDIELPANLERSEYLVRLKRSA